MKETKLRTVHRTMGIILAVFFILHAGTGVLLTVLESEPDSAAGVYSPEQAAAETEQENEFVEGLEYIHTKGGPVGVVYRLVVGIGVLGMSSTGLLMFSRIRARQRKRSI